MKRNRNTEERKPSGHGRHEHPLPQEISEKEKEIVSRAHDEAIEDISEDPDLNERPRNEDLDEGESARLGGDKNALI
jgi:hypothetical protein